MIPCSLIWAISTVDSVPGRICVCLVIFALWPLEIVFVSMAFAVVCLAPVFGYFKFKAGRTDRQKRLHIKTEAAIKADRTILTDVKPIEEKIETIENKCAMNAVKIPFFILFLLVVMLAMLLTIAGLAILMVAYGVLCGIPAIIPYYGFLIYRFPKLFVHPCSRSKNSEQSK